MLVLAAPHINSIKAEPADDHRRAARSFGMRRVDRARRAGLELNQTALQPFERFGLVIGKCGRGHIGRRVQELSKGQLGIDGVVASIGGSA